MKIQQNAQFPEKNAFFTQRVMARPYPLVTSVTGLTLPLPKCWICP